MHLVVDQASKVYGDYSALNGVSFSLQKGEAFALLGGNGAGKSTLIKSIMSLIKLDEGTITKDGRCAFLPEQPYLPDTMSAIQLVSYACKIQGVSKSFGETLLDEVKLKKNAWKKPISSYSKGMKQRTALAYVLAGKPDWLILDEPMSGLDAMGRSLVLEILNRRKSEGLGILMCSHLVTDIVQLCDKVLVMVQGEIKEVIPVTLASMEQANFLEEQLKHWSGDAVLD